MDLIPASHRDISGDNFCWRAIEKKHAGENAENDLKFLRVPCVKKYGYAFLLIK